MSQVRPGGCSITLLLLLLLLLLLAALRSVRLRF
jgi:hypothetical protein